MVEQRFGHKFAKKEALGFEDTTVSKSMFKLLTASVDSIDYSVEELTLRIDSDSESDVDESSYDEFSDIFELSSRSKAFCSASCCASISKASETEVETSQSEINTKKYDIIKSLEKLLHLLKVIQTFSLNWNG